MAPQLCMWQCLQLLVVGYLQIHSALVAAQYYNSSSTSNTSFAMCQLSQQVVNAPPINPQFQGWDCLSNTSLQNSSYCSWSNTACAPNSSTIMEGICFFEIEYNSPCSPSNTFSTPGSVYYIIYSLHGGDLIQLYFRFGLHGYTSH